jgi:hypothetical protein
MKGEQDDDDEITMANEGGRRGGRRARDGPGGEHPRHGGRRPGGGDRGEPDDADDGATGATPATGATAAPDPATEQYRPLLHFSPERNWMNDPNGLVYDERHLAPVLPAQPLRHAWGT